ncbi:MAG TPA: diguanylate cyclase, partial [Iamia sp.]|nr:diguanylate cyclase [Iamia sp.]
MAPPDAPPPSETSPAERRFRKLVGYSSDVIVVVAPDARIRWISPSVETVLGHTPEALLGLPAQSLVHPDDVPRAWERVVGDGAGPSDEPFSVRAPDADGEWRHLRVRFADLSSDPDIEGFIFTIRDVSREVESETARQRLSMALEASTDLVGMLTLADGRVAMNRAGLALLGLDEASSTLDALTTRVPPWVHHRVIHEVVPALEASGLWEGELAVHDAEGDAVPLSVVMVALRDDEHMDSVAVVGRDISERKAFEDQLEHQATHDPLTGLPNRTLLLDRLRVAVARAGRQQSLAAVLFLDLDNFKIVNDSLGHAAGDALLKEVARRLNACVRPNDLVARLGGDEFAILLEETPQPAEVISLGQRLLKSLERPVSINGTEVRPFASVGITFSDMGYRDPDEVLRDADLAMYKAKADGKGQLALFDASLHEQLGHKLQLESDLRRAIGEGQLSLAFQGLFDLDP